MFWPNPPRFYGMVVGSDYAKEFKHNLLRIGVMKTGAGLEFGQIDSLYVR